MASIKLLSGVAHDIAHHSQSSLSGLHPHLAQACRSVGVNRIVLEILSEQLYPASLPKLKPLETALSNLQEKFWKMIDLKNISRECIVSAQLVFIFPWSHDDYFCSVRAIVTTSVGKIFTRKVDVWW